MKWILINFWLEWKKVFIIVVDFGVIFIFFLVDLFIKLNKKVKIVDFIKKVVVVFIFVFLVYKLLIKVFVFLEVKVKR